MHEDTKETLADYTVDVLCGGFPCQPVSYCGKRKGESDERWLWPEFFRVIRLLRPRWVVIENVPALRTLGLSTVLRDLATIRYDAEWVTFPASWVGTPMQRNRLFVVAEPECHRSQRIFSEPVPRFEAFSWNKNVRRVEDIRGMPGIPEPVIRRTGHGLSLELYRLKGLGNACVPQVVEYIGRQIMKVAT